MLHFKKMLSTLVYPNGWTQEHARLFYNGSVPHVLARLSRLADSMEAATQVNPDMTHPSQRFFLDTALNEIRASIGLHTLQQKPYYSSFKAMEHDVVAMMALIIVGGMSHGAVHNTAHRDIATGATKAGARSNSGEGGEQSDRIGTFAGSQIKQVSSARFGVDLPYLMSGELQIKVIQGAKPSVGGMLTGEKVTLEISQIRRTQEGIPLYSPPIHPDLYSIEDLYLLVHALKCLYPGQKVSIKLGASEDLPIIALGCVKAGVDSITIAGHDGGTGAATYTDVYHTGMPWETALHRTHLFLAQQGVREQVQLVASGGIKTGEDIVKALLLGANEVELGTSILVALGCVMLRQCHRGRSVSVRDFEDILSKTQALLPHDMQAREFALQIFNGLVDQGKIDKVGNILPGFNPSDPVMSPLERQIQDVLHFVQGGCDPGINTQDAVNATKYKGRPESVEDILFFMAGSAVEHMRKLSIKSAAEAVGQASRYLRFESNAPFQMSGFDFYGFPVLPKSHDIVSPLPIPARMDIVLIEQLKRSVEDGNNIHRFKVDVSELDTSFLIALSGFCEVHGINDPIEIRVESGYLPQNTGAFLRQNITIFGPSGNDHIGKGLSGGHIILKEDRGEAIIGNSCLYGATGGELLVSGHVGTRFAIRNSGADFVIYNAGDHCGEFMTGGTGVILGKVGRNFAAAMTGGKIFIDEDQNKAELKGKKVYPLTEALEKDLFDRLTAFYTQTGSERAKRLLDNWDDTKRRFVCVDPKPIARQLTDTLKVGAPLLARYPLAYDEMVGQGLSTYPLEDTAIEFHGKAGTHFGTYLPENCTFTLHGSAGIAAANYAKGTVIINGDCGPYAGNRASGTVVVEGFCGHHALHHFNGTAVVVHVGMFSCEQLGASAKVFITGKIEPGFAKNIHPDARIFVDIVQNPEFNIGEPVDPHIRDLFPFTHLPANLAHYRLITKKELDTLQLDPPAFVPVLPDIQVQHLGWDTDILSLMIMPMAQMGKDEPKMSMGNPNLFGNAFFLNAETRLPERIDPMHFVKEGFSQITNPPYAVPQEQALCSTEVVLGGGFLSLDQLQGKTPLAVPLKFPHPIVSAAQLSKLESSRPVLPVSISFKADSPEQARQAMLDCLDKAVEHIKKTLSDTPVKTIMLCHDQDGFAIPSWFAAAYIQKHCKGFSFDLVVKTNELLSPHLLDLMVNVGGVKLVAPVMTEVYIKTQVALRENDKGFMQLPDECWENYLEAMKASWQRILAKASMSSAQTRVGAKAAEHCFFDAELSGIVGLPGVPGNISVDAIALFAMTSVKPSPKHILKLSKHSPAHAWDPSQISDMHLALRPQQEPIPDIEDLGSSPALKPPTANFGLWKAYEKTVARSQQGLTIKDSLVFLKPKPVAVVVGTGVAGLKAMLELSQKGFEVVGIGQDYELGGKVSYKVAPDHEGPQMVLDRLIKDILKDPKIKLVLGTKVTADLLKNLRQQSSVVVLATGSSPNKLQVPGKELAVSVAKMASWYTSKPSETDQPRKSPLPEDTRQVCVYGFGNASLDIARILTKPTHLLPVSQSVKQELDHMDVRTVMITGRAPNPKDTKFSLAELLELETLEKEGHIHIQVSCLPEIIDSLQDNQDPIVQFFLRHIQTDSPAPGAKVIRFMFGMELESITESGAGKTALFKNGIRLEQVEVVSSIGFSPNRKLQVDQTHELAPVYYVGQAALGIGQVESSMQNAVEVLSTVHANQTTPVIFPYQTVEALSQNAYEKDDYELLQHAIHTGVIPRPLTEHGYQSALNRIRLERRLGVMMPSALQSDSELPLIPVTLTVHTNTAEAIVLNIPEKRSRETLHDVFKRELPPGNDKGTCSTGTCKGCTCHIKGGKLTRTKMESMLPEDQYLGCMHEVRELQESSATVVFSSEISRLRSECGLAFHASMQPSEETVLNGIKTMAHSSHRGSGVGSASRDGAGAIVDIDHSFFSKALAADGIDLGQAGTYAIGQFFVPNKTLYPSSYDLVVQHLNEYLKKNGLELIAVRDVPVDDSILLPDQRQKPSIIQIFTRPDSTSVSTEPFPQVISRMGFNCEEDMRVLMGWTTTLSPEHFFRISSFSTEVVVYKGMLGGDQMPYFKDLVSGYKSSIFVGHVRFATNVSVRYDLAHPFSRGGSFGLNSPEQLLGIIHNGEVVSKPKLMQFLSHYHDEILRVYKVNILTDNLSDSAVVELYLATLQMIFQDAAVPLSLPGMLYLLSQPRNAGINPLLDFAQAYFPLAEGPFTLGIYGKHEGRPVFIGGRDSFGLRPGHVTATSDSLDVSSERFSHFPKDPSRSSIREGGITIFYLDNFSQVEYDPMKHDPHFVEFISTGKT